MVKFSKELEAQLIPEWKEAFVNYWQLKKNIKRIKLRRKPAPEISSSAGDYGFSILDPIRYIGKMVVEKFLDGGEKGDVIQVKKKLVGDEQDRYETDLVQVFTDDDEVRGFFERLDEQLNKVNQFYRTKEAEFVERGEILQKQLQILLDLKRILHERGRKKFPARSDSGFLFTRSNSSSVKNSDCSESVTESDEPENSPADSMIAVLEKNGINFIGITRSKTKKDNMKTKNKLNMAMRIDIPATNPTRTISAITSMIWEDLVNNPKKENSGEFINKKKIQCAEKMIRGAFVELYKGLGLLKTYSSLNLVAFTKILKKFDKVSSQQASGTYLKAVKRSHFISSDKVVRLGDEVESLFTKHFANNDRKKAMKFLKPQQQKGSHMITFFCRIFWQQRSWFNDKAGYLDSPCRVPLIAREFAQKNFHGLFTGCFVTLFTVYAFLAHLSGMYSAITEAGYMETVYPLFSMFALLSLHVFLYGCNLFTWRSTRINYNFIFEFSSNTALKYRDVFLICTSLMTLVVGAMVTHLILRANNFPPRQIDAIPGILFLLFTGLLICPFNVFYRSSRYCFLRVIRNIICAPFYKVLMVDFFMADQLTSQIPLLRHMEFTACYFIAEGFKTHQYQTCTSSKLYKELAYVISFMPYYWRAMQCARRWFDEGDINHVANLGKYVSAMLAAGARLTYAMQPTPMWLAIVIINSTIATIYQLYWDFVKDWGLLNPKSKHPWLRDELALKHKSIYYASIALNFVLRLAWVETVMHINIGRVDHRVLDFFLASLEVIRRGHWNFYRLENEHLNNVGKFRAVKTVPLPFRDMDLDD